MRQLLSLMTRGQQSVLLALLALNVVWIYGALFMALTVWRAGAVPIEAPTPDLQVAEAPHEASSPAALNIAALVPTPTPTRIPSPARTAAPSPVPPPATRIPSPTPASPAATSTRRPVPPRPALAGPRALASMELDPYASLASKTSFFTSACFGADANLRQDKDNMAPADWSGSPDRRCIFGYGPTSADGLPSGRYSVYGGPDGQPHFNIIPPEAFAGDQTQLKQLSQVHLIVDPEQGCPGLGSIGVTADGVRYQCSACAFLRAGGVCPAGDGTKSLVLPANRNNVLDPNDNGGAYGFVNFPAVLFRKGFSLYFTGKDGYAPPRVYFESTVDTLRPRVNAKTTAEMTAPEIQAVAAEFDSALTGVDPTGRLAALEREAQLTSAERLVLRPKERGSLYFTTTPGAVLSSISWSIRPLTTAARRGFLETNLCLGLNGEESCFTGVEDFAHCAFFVPCQAGYSNLAPTAGERYIATRYFAPGTAPAINDGRISAGFQAPDVGTVIEIEVKVRVRNVPAGPGK